MRLKEIKPGMVIHCRNNEEKKALYDELCRIGNIRASNKLDSFENFRCTTENYIIKDLNGVTWGFTNENDAIEFSDLILPELTAEEVLQIATEICNVTKCVDCPMDGCCFKNSGSEKKKVVEAITQWKSSHEKKEPEIETVDICRIIEVQPDGRKRCVHEEDIKHYPELPYGSEEIAVHEILKRYCMEHEGEFIAVHEVVSRVKAVE